MSTIPPEYHTTPLPTNPVDDWYLSSYARTRIHRSMISDRVRTDAYKKAIEMNRHLIKVNFDLIFVPRFCDKPFFTHDG